MSTIETFNLQELRSAEESLRERVGQLGRFL